MNRTQYGINIKSRAVGWVGALVLLSLALAACAPAAATAVIPPAATQAPVVVASDTPAPTQAPTASSGVTINVKQDAALGPILVDGNGMTLYLWKNDAKGVSNCADKCLANWPPLLASGPVTAGAGLNASDFGTTATTDGKTMVTYTGLPLYYFIGDKAAGDTKGQGVGNVWYIVPPAAPTAATGVTVNVKQDAALGPILVDGNGMTLYLWKNDAKGVSNCADKCLANWPPLLASGPVTAGAGLNASDFGTTATTDGKTMVTYTGLPLYYFIGDKAAGDTKGQGVGNVWYVVPPAAPTAAMGVTVNVKKDAALGNILVDGNGMTLYLWKNDTMNTSTCAAKCLANWPPLLASGEVTAGTGLDDSNFGTTQTTDGKTMITYKGAPLYYFIGDKAAGDTKGQGVGNVWYVVAP